MMNDEGRLGEMRLSRRVLLVSRVTTVLAVVTSTNILMSRYANVRSILYVGAFSINGSVNSKPRLPGFGIVSHFVSFHACF